MHLPRSKCTSGQRNVDGWQSRFLPGCSVEVVGSPASPGCFSRSSVIRRATAHAGHAGTNRKSGPPLNALPLYEPMFPHAAPQRISRPVRFGVVSTHTSAPCGLARFTAGLAGALGADGSEQASSGWPMGRPSREVKSRPPVQRHPSWHSKPCSARPTSRSCNTKAARPATKWSTSSTGCVSRRSSSSTRFPKTPHHTNVRCSRRSRPRRIMWS